MNITVSANKVFLKDIGCTVYEHQMMRNRIIISKDRKYVFVPDLYEFIYKLVSAEFDNSILTAADVCLIIARMRVLAEINKTE